MEAVILYSTNDYRFFKCCIDNLLKLNIKCHIVTYTHMWNGDEENQELLKKSINLFQNNDLVNFYTINWHPGESPWYWEGLGRYLATQNTPDDSDYILYIDIDEIVDPERFTEWINTEEIKKYDAIQLAQYWYWREPIYQSKNIEYTTVILNTKIAKQLEFFKDGRASYFKAGNIKGQCGGNNPFIHHFSWVRTKQEMLNKTSNWGHAGERNWEQMIETEFSRPFNGVDFVHGYEYNVVENIFNL
jgi:hypothetical protein